MNDPPPEAEGCGGHDEPPSPDHQGGPEPVGANGPEGEDRSGGEKDERCRNEPGGLGSELGVEHAEQPGGPPAAPGAGRPPADAAGLVAGEAAEAVVAEHQVPEAVVLGPADVRA